MNPVLKLNTKLFKETPEYNGPGLPNLKKGVTVSAKHIRFLTDQLKKIRDEWGGYSINANPVISAYYTKMVPKSSRIKRLLAGKDGTSDSSVVGARYWYGTNDAPRHQIVHCVTPESLDKTIATLERAARAIDETMGGYATQGKLSDLAVEEKREHWNRVLKEFDLKRTVFCQSIVDLSFIKSFAVDKEAPEITDDAIVTLYKTELSLADILEKAGIPHSGLNKIDDSTIVLKSNEYAKLAAKAPYLISMGLVEWSSLPRDTGDDSKPSRGRSIQAPTNEPIIGVIDTLFDEDAGNTYFASWVKAHDLVSPDIERDDVSYKHGTCVTSILVDGARLNPLRDDGCGNFRVRHYGIAASNRFSLLTLMREIEHIVAENRREVRVWNLSLGSTLEISTCSISPVAALLDRIQKQYDVIFVIAGTNNPNDEMEQGSLRLGSPADSINALVVNALDGDGSPASYTRKGPVLEYFTKPDVAYFGGDSGESCLTWFKGAEHYSQGTSYAAPWIARKLAYLIDIMGLSKEVAKALIIDSASGWSNPGDPCMVGHGIVPTRIEDIVQSADDEIRFILYGTAGPNKTYSYNLPVPKSKGKQPYYAKSTLCYFPSCSRQQGVDYTNTEVDLKVGRIKDGHIVPINNNRQGELYAYITEDEARTEFRKWNNVKHIRESIKERRIPRTTYANPNWGFELNAKKRLDATQREELPFGIVITLKEMDGENRLATFIRNCRANGIMVEPLDIDASIDLRERADTEISFDD
jgi:Subtilisin-like serine proteases